ncbi:MAG: winged helix-turn-helix domain-containing protein [Acidobacteriota bacterium]
MSDRYCDSQPARLTRKERELLALLARHAGEIVPRDVLLMSVWGYGREIRTRTLDVHIRRLRMKLGLHRGRHIETIFGVGYRLQPDREPRPYPELALAAQ